MLSCVVYWLFDDRCICPWRHGYIGISVEFDARLHRHRKRAGSRKSAVGVPTIFDHKILFTGTVDECAAWEEKLRPYKGIGWNRAPGGRKPWLDYKHDATARGKISEGNKKSGHMKLPKSADHREKQRATRLNRYASDPTYHAAIVAHLKTIDHAGVNNGMFGKSHSEASKQIMRERKMKTVCKRGHSKEPGKPCRECQRMWSHLWYMKKKPTFEGSP